MKKKMFCAECIVALLKELGGKSTRKELRPLLLEKGYGSEGIRQAYLKLQREKIITVQGASHSPNQIIILNDEREEN